jgi:hypothetical protein
LKEFPWWSLLAERFSPPASKMIIFVFLGVEGLGCVGYVSQEGGAFLEEFLGDGKFAVAFFSALSGHRDGSPIFVFAEGRDFGVISHDDQVFEFRPTFPDFRISTK